MTTTKPEELAKVKGKAMSDFNRKSSPGIDSPPPPRDPSKSNGISQTTTKAEDLAKVKGKAINDFKRAADAGADKRDNSGSPERNGPPPEKDMRAPAKEEARTQKGNELHKEALKPKGPSLGR